MMIANRTLPRAQVLSQQLTCVSEIMILADLPQYLHEYDIIISSTASQLPIIGKGMVESAIKQRKHQPIFMLDLAVPRDIEIEVSELEDVFLYTLDDIASVVELGKAARKKAAAEAEVILNTALVDFNKGYSRLCLAPYSKALREHSEAIRLASLELAHKKIAQGHSTESVLAELSMQITNQMLHPLYQAFNTPSIAYELAKFYSFQPDVDHE
ncbi:MAG: glutamyl-tRNA reductase, partial [Neisseriaceae bacterium]|nr:glutamyl-tRNA reductase [Neisseriaceae bacterium]